MRYSSIISIGAVIAMMASAHADDRAICQGSLDLTSVEIGCEGETMKTVSIASCDFPESKTPSVSASLRRWDYDADDFRASVTVSNIRANRFTIHISTSSDDGNGMCRLGQLRWRAE